MTHLDCDITAYKRARAAEPEDPILTQLITLRDAYALHLARVSIALMDKLFKQGCVEDLRKAIGELDKQIANQRKGA